MESTRPKSIMENIQKFFEENKNTIAIVACVLVVALIVFLIWRGLTCARMTFTPTVHSKLPVTYEMLDDDGSNAAPSNEDILKQYKLNGPRCGITEREMLGYHYQLPEELPSVESLMPDESASDSYYDPEAAQDVPYVFTYPLTGSITKTRIEQSGDMWRGDLNVTARDPRCDFKTIWNPGDQLLHGAFSNYTYKSHELAGCGNQDVWVRNSPINVANEELVQDYS